MTAGPLHVLLVGAVDAAVEDELDRDGFDVRRSASPAEIDGDLDLVLLALPADRPLETYSVARSSAPETALLVLTTEGRDADGQAAVRAGADDHLPASSIGSGLLPRICRYAVEHHRMRRQLRSIGIADELTGLPNLHGFVPVAEHHFRMADRARRPVVLIFVRIDDLEDLQGTLGRNDADELVADAAGVILAGVRDADYVGRVADDTFCVLLTGEAHGAEPLVLSRLVESIASRNARGDGLGLLSLSIGSALYDPDNPLPMEGIINTALRRMAEQRSAARGAADRSDGS
jgi:diguanylate cyclase (GGDEF)-like protein